MQECIGCVTTSAHKRPYHHHHDHPELGRYPAIICKKKNWLAGYFHETCLRAWHTGLRTRITAYVSANSYVYVCRYGIALYTHGRTQPSGRGSNLVYMHHIWQGRTQERGLRSDPRYEKRRGGGGGGGGLLYASGPLSTPVRYTYSMVKVSSLWGEGPSTPHLPPLRRIRHVVTQCGTSCYF